MAASPIADLSYRNYDGGLESPRLRWWVIARMMMRQAAKKKSYWVALAISGWYYLAMMFILFIFDQIATQAQGRPSGINPAMAFFQRISWHDQFLHGLSFGQLLFLVITLLLGAGTIANDNRANALLVYLSKPCSKRDYLFGKWMGVFLPLAFAMLVPSLIFYLYGAMSYREYGFTEDKWLLLKVLATIPIMAAFHASMIIGISSMFNQGRIAGAAYAGLYFLSGFFTKIMTVMWISYVDEGDSPVGPELIKRLFYFSVDGLNIGVIKSVLATDGSAYFGIESRLRSVPMPSFWMVFSIMVILSVFSMWLAWTRVRAVEVVG